MPKNKDATIEKIANSHGFSLMESAELAEIDGFAHVMKHNVSGARLMYLQNSDSNKSFSISFKTPAADDTGVFHILEHSVLCGSEKFPVKEPFVNLLKSSMQTFLNAMTFPDKTMYPVASTNEKDLMNLMDVYLDAVFHPNIYRSKEIFEQEGWHLEFQPRETSDDERKLVYNGVVFNEMKGALSDSDSVLFDTLSAALFPDTTYRFESGGTPEAIPTLTYEAFLDNHQRHYRPDNSYIILYGDMDLDTFLAFISEKYLCPVAMELASKQNAFSVNTSSQSKSSDPNPLEIQKPVRSKGVKKELVTTPDNSCAALGFVIAQASQREKIIAVDILMDAIMGSNESPLKKALIEANIANDYQSQVVDSLAQPFVMIQAKGLKENAVCKLEQVVNDQIKKLSEGALDKNLVRAALSHAEFVMREQNFGYPDGVILSMSAMSGWLYDEDMPYDYIMYEDVFANLRKKIDTDYFENLLSEVFLKNNHVAQVEVVPVDRDSNPILEKRLETLELSLDADGIKEIETQLAALRQAQESPDTPENLAKLPKLELSDIGDAPFEPAFGVVEQNGQKILRHEVSTHGIAYFYRYYSMADIAYEDLAYASILAMVLGKLDTKNHSAIELDTLVQEKLGSLSFLTQVHDSGDQGDQSGQGVQEDMKGIRPQFMIGASALKENCEAVPELIREIIETSNLDDAKRIYDILIQRRTMMEQKFAISGNTYAMSRAASYYSKSAIIREQIGGIDFYKFLRDLTNNFEQRSDALISKLKELSCKLFSQSAMLSFAGDDESLERYLSIWQDDLVDPEDMKKLSCAVDIPEPKDKKEAFVAPCDVTFSVASFNRASVAQKLTGPWLVASRILTYDYLWNAVRVVGGAYGVGFNTTRQGQSYFYSYRDPHVDETISRFNGSGDWVKEFSPSDDEFDGFIVSTASTFDAPQKPRTLILRQDGMFFADYTTSQRLELRDQVIHTKLADIHGLAPLIDALCESESICCVGNREIIESSNMDFDVIDLFN